MPSSFGAIVLYVCIPSYNEAVTVGVLLWRLRTTLREQAGGRDYEIVVYDDASTDATADVLAPYARVLPLTVLRGAMHTGQAAAVDALIRHVVGRSHAPDTDALLLMQADYSDSPELVGELVPLFDAGADIVLARRAAAPDQPPGERRLRRSAPVLLPLLARAAVGDSVARDPIALLSTMRLFRVAVLRDALAAAGRAPIVRAPGWAGTVELIVRTAPFARRIEGVDVPARYDVRTRPSRIDWTRELRAIVALLWQSRNASRAAERRTAPVAPPPVAPSPVAPALRLEPVNAPRPERSSTVRTADVPRVKGRGPERATVRTSIPAPERAPETTASEPTAPEGTGAADIAAAETETGESGPTSRPSRRRRRSRGRQGAGAAQVAADVPEQAAFDASPAGEPHTDAAPAEETPPEDGPTVAEGEPIAPTKRRRRRGGARRRPRGPESDMGVSPDVGVSPERPDSGTTPWQGAPSDEPSS